MKSFLTGLKNAIKAILGLLGVEVSGYPTFRGLIFRGFWIRLGRPRRAGSLKPFNGYLAFQELRNWEFHSVIDVGSGGGGAARAFAQNGKAVTCVDLGRSTYFREGAAHGNEDDSVRVIPGDFLELPIQGAFDLVWASHVLEHQKNVGAFLRRLADHCHEGSIICITVPVCDYRLVGGHLTLWTPGLLAYNLVVNGIDCRDSKLVQDGREFSILVRKRAIALPTLDFDSGDVDRLKEFFPAGFREGQSSLRYW